LAERDYSGLLAEIADELIGRSPRSTALNRAAKANLVNGGSHTIRLMEPFPPRIVSARDGRATDEDGHDILDFWHGHLANILGHNPEVAEILCRRTGDEQARLAAQ